MKTLNAVLGAAILVTPTLGHVAIKPPSPDKALTPNSSVAPPGCKLLASDKGWPADDVWLKEFPRAFKKMKGTEGPDWWIQPQSVGGIQKAVKFARRQNIRLGVITSGHDFHGREDQRSGLRIDLASMMEPTVFSNEWTCGKSLKAKTKSGRVVDEVIACKIPNETKNLVGRSIPQRAWRWQYFDKRDGLDCDSVVKEHLKKRNELEEPYKFDTSKPWEWAVKTGFKLPANAEFVPGFNKIKPTGEFAYARVPAGLHNEEFFGQADASGLMTLGAQHGGVSVIGGWLQAGGHNPFAHKFGMAAENVVEFEVVTPDGKFQKASACSNPELYWALRGGGGSTFGIVTAATVKVFPTFPIVVSRFMVNVSKPYDPKLWEATAHFLQQGATARDKYGLQGYFYIYPNGFHSVLHMPDKFATLSNAKTVTTELMTEMEKLAGGTHIEPHYYEYKTYKDWYIAEMGDEEMEDNGKHFLSWYDGSWGDCPASPDVMMNPMLVIPWKIEEAQREAAAAKSGHSKRAVKIPRTQPMGRTYLDSRLLSDKMVNSVSREKLAKAVDETFPRITGNNVRGFLYGGGKMAQAKVDDMGLLPAWRDMTYHYIVNAVPGGGRHDYNIRNWDKLFPEAGAYVNEASPGEPNWKEKFWGAHYPKLETIKKKVDPNNVLWCSPCVGADMFTYDDERLCKNPNYPQSGPPPQTYKNDASKVGIASLPGEPGIPNPLGPIIQTWMKNKTLPATMPRSNYFKLAMGQGGSSGGKWSLGPGNAVVAPAAEHGHEGMDMGHMG